MSALVGSQWIKTEIVSHPRPSAPPIVESQVVSSSYENQSGPVPEVSFIINHAWKLHLTAAQLASLKALEQKWQGPVAQKSHKRGRLPLKPTNI